MSKVIYVDSNNCCHPYNDGTMTAVELDFFSNKCDSFIEGYKCEVNNGCVAVYPWKSYDVLCAYQSQYESDLSEIEDMRTALDTMGVNIDG